MLLNAVTVDKDDKNFLSFRWSTSPCCSIRACLPGVKFHSSSCCSLTFIVARCASSLNGEELVRDGGVQLLATLLSRCMYVVQPSTPGNEPQTSCEHFQFLVNLRLPDLKYSSFLG
ncbi:hypothetical protein S83_036937 [Arachis hypogaea]